MSRWSMSCLDMLPEYMKLVYQQLLYHHQEIEESLENEGKAYQLHYLKEMVYIYILHIHLLNVAIHAD